MKSILQFLANTILPILVLGAGVVVAQKVIASKPAPEISESETVGPLVQTAAAEARVHRDTIQGQGQVVAARQLTVIPEIAGRIVEMHPQLFSGGRIAEGEDLIRINTDTYYVNVLERQTDLEQAETQRALEEGRREVAQREWELFADQLPADANASLALREPQIRSVEVSIEAAEVRLRRAQLDLARSTLSAPFNALVLQENVEMSQYVAPGTQVATLVGTDEFWVEVAVPVGDLSRIDIPGFNAETGSTVRLLQDVGGRTRARQGRVVRLLADLTPSGRLARVLVQVDDPLLITPEGRELAQAGIPPLLLGSYVRAEIDGKRDIDTVVVPRDALRDGVEVWVAEPDDTLSIREVHIVERRESDVLVTSGVSAGERLIVSHVEAPVDGMELRIVEEGESVLDQGPSTQGDSAADNEASGEVDDPQGVLDAPEEPSETDASTSGDEAGVGTEASDEEAAQ